MGRTKDRPHAFSVEVLVMSNVYHMKNYIKGEVSMVCESCGEEDEPIEKSKTAIVCSHCQYPFSYFECSKYFNNKKEARLKEERAKANQSVKREYRL